MYWLLVFSAALLCSSIIQAHPVIGDGKSNEPPESTRAQIEKELKEAMQELQLAEKLAEETDTREARGLLKKVAFLAGMRVGGLVQSSGTLAASNSLRVFGKVVNSALSVSYGTIDELNTIPGIEGGPILAERPHLEPASVKVTSFEETHVPVSSPVQITQSVKETEEQAHRNIKANFLKGHNELVGRVNANSKFLRTMRANDFDKTIEIR